MIFCIWSHEAKTKQKCLCGYCCGGARVWDKTMNVDINLIIVFYDGNYDGSVALHWPVITVITPG